MYISAISFPDEGESEGEGVGDTGHDTASIGAAPGGMAGIDPWVGMDFTLEFRNVTLELLSDGLLAPSAADGTGPTPLARLDLADSSVLYRGYDNGTADDLGMLTAFASRSMYVHDTRPCAEGSASAFTQTLSPLLEGGAAGAEAGASAGAVTPQLQVTYQDNPAMQNIHCILNRARVLVLPDWVLEMQRFVATRQPTVLRLPQEQGVISPGETAVERALDVTLSVTDTEFDVLEDRRDPASDAMVLKFCSVLKLTRRPDGDPDQASSAPLLAVEAVLDNLEVFSCQMNQQDSTALSILDPCKLTVELRHESSPKTPVTSPPVTTTSVQLELASASAHHGNSVTTAPVVTRLSFKDLRLFRAIAKGWVHVPLLPKGRTLSIPSHSLRSLRPACWCAIMLVCTHA